MLDTSCLSGASSEQTETNDESTDKMKMADGTTIVRRNRPGTKSEVI